MAPSYHELPHHGIISLKTGEAVEFRAQNIITVKGKNTYTGVYVRRHDGIIDGPFTISLNLGKPTIRKQVKNMIRRKLRR